MPTALFLPAGECRRGVSPIQAPNYAAESSCLESPKVAKAAEALTGAMSISVGALF